jgi:alcohol dehydrogenase
VNFEFAAPPRILFGEGRVREVPALARSLGSRALVVEGQSGRAESLARALHEAGLAPSRFQISSEPTVALIERATAFARHER